MVGDVSVRGGLVVSGEGGLEMEGIELGRWERGNRVGMRVSLGESVWSEGIRVEGVGLGLNVEGDVRVGGSLEVGRLVLRGEKGCKTRELEEEEVEFIMRELEVEMDEGGGLVGKGGDMWEMMKKMMVVIGWQSRKIKNLI